jgi:hypothetical protein
MWPFTRKRNAEKFDWSVYDALPLPRPAIDWHEPWHQLAERQEQLGVQRELDCELSAAHPLWGTEPVVFGRHQGTDDILVALADGRFAIVHLVWHGHVDQFPAEFPSTETYANLDDLRAELARSAEEWANTNKK